MHCRTSWRLKQSSWAMRSDAVPSNALTGHLVVLLADAVELDRAHAELRTGRAGRQWGLGSLNRGVVGNCVSAWEAYIEQLVRESLHVLRPASPPGVWQSLNAFVEDQLTRFNNPIRDNVRNLIQRAIGLSDIHTFWSWQNCTSDQAMARLTHAMTLRHEIARGVNPRPTVHNSYSRDLPIFFRRLAHCTDEAVRRHLISVHGITNPWTP
jgi:hypothetical protein